MDSYALTRLGETPCAGKISYVDISKYRGHYLVDAHGRECSGCREYKPWNEFSPNTRDKSTGHQSRCKTCRNASQVAAASLNREAWRRNKQASTTTRRKRAGIPSAEERCAAEVRRWEITAAGRRCRVCQLWKPWDEFYRRPDDAGKHMARCKQCYADLAQELRYARFGMTRQQYLWLVQQQDGRCALCRQHETRCDHRTGLIWSLSVEHDHSCLEHSSAEACPKCVRGLACDRCNRLIGKVEEIGGVVAARFADYLAQRPLLHLSS